MMEECLSSTEELIPYEEREHYIRERFHSLGFTGGRKLLKLPADEVVICIHLSRGTWLNRNFIDLGIFFIKLSTASTPKSFSDCHMSMGILHLADEATRHKLLAVLDGKSASYDNITDFYLSYVEPFARQFRTLNLAKQRILSENSGLGDLGVQINPIVYK